MKKFLVTLLKIALSAAMLGYLVWDAATTRSESGENVLLRLLHQPKNWWVLAAAWLCCTAGVTLTLIRWWYLVRALEIPLRLRDALRIGFLGYLFNLAPMGIVGGDLLKGWLLARENRGRRMAAFASVVVDRLIGLYLLFVVASVALLLGGYWSHPSGDLRALCRLTVMVTALGGVAMGVLLIPGLTDGRGTRALGRLPRVGHALESLIQAMRMYRRKPRVLANAALMSVGVHCLFTVGMHLIARGLPDRSLLLGEHFIVAPLSAIVGVIPLPAGPQEGALQYLYGQVLGAPAKAKGLVMGLTYRLITVLIAAVGVCYYLGRRREVAEVMHEAQHEQRLDGQPAADPLACSHAGV